MFGIFSNSIKKSKIRRKSIAHVKSEEIININMKNLIRFVERYLKIKRDRIYYIEQKKDKISNYLEEIKEAKFNYNFVYRIYENCLEEDTLSIAMKEVKEYMELIQDYLGYIKKYEDPFYSNLDIDKEILFIENNIIVCYKIIDLIIECQNNKISSRI